LRDKRAKFGLLARPRSNIEALSMASSRRFGLPVSLVARAAKGMKKISYSGRRFLPEIIQQTI
jgi:hypothetical protein